VKIKKTVASEVQQDLPTGAIVLVPIDKVDHSKVCPKRLPCVVVECAHDKFRLACRTVFKQVVLQIQWLVDGGMCTAIAQELVTLKDATAERQAYCATVGTIPKTVNVTTSLLSTQNSTFNND
jgi:hypothetical protein